MSLIVQKFGGTSVATADKIRRAAARAVAAFREGKQVVMVVSARGKKTDELVALAAEMTDSPAPREMDVLLSTGEQETISLTAMAIHAMGEKALSVTGTQMGMMTDSAHTKARIRRIDTDRMRRLLNEGNILIAAGFQGIDEDLNITTFGRGGSDTTATALAAALGAEECEIYTDVEGIFTTDPRIVPEARKLEHITYDEMLELASLGAGVMHARSIEFAKKYRVPLRVRSSFSEDPGTLISAASPETNQRVVSGIAQVRNEVLVKCRNIPDRPGVTSSIFERMAERKIAIDLVVQNVGHDGLAQISFSVPQDDLADALTAAEQAVAELGMGEVSHVTNVSKVSAVGSGMQYHTGVAGEMFKHLGEAGIPIQVISTSEIKISVLVNRDRANDAVLAAHKGFHLDQASVEPPEVGWPQEEIPEPSTEQPPREVEAIVGLSNMEDIVVSEVDVDASQARVTVRGLPDDPGVAAELMTAVAEGDVMVDMIVQNTAEHGTANLTFTVPEESLGECLLLVRAVCEQWPEIEIEHSAEIAKLSVLGIGLRSHTDVGRKMFTALAENDINIIIIGTSEIRMSAIIHRDQAETARVALERAFGLFSE